VTSIRPPRSVEEETLRTGVANGYFGTSREGTLPTLAEELAVFNNLRRSERKLLERVGDALDEFDGAVE
jgi:predicted DNA binding protein